MVRHDYRWLRTDWNCGNIFRKTKLISFHSESIDANIVFFYKTHLGKPIKWALLMRTRFWNRRNVSTNHALAFISKCFFFSVSSRNGRCCFPHLRRTVKFEPFILFPYFSLVQPAANEERQQNEEEAKRGEEELGEADEGGGQEEVKENKWSTRNVCKRGGDVMKKTNEKERAKGAKFMQMRTRN